MIIHGIERLRHRKRRGSSRTRGSRLRVKFGNGICWKFAGAQGQYRAQFQRISNAFIFRYLILSNGIIALFNSKLQAFFSGRVHIFQVRVPSPKVKALIFLANHLTTNADRLLPNIHALTFLAHQLRNKVVQLTIKAHQIRAKIRRLRIKAQQLRVEAAQHHAKADCLRVDSHTQGTNNANRKTANMGFYHTLLARPEVFG